nr:hypothetical protein [Rubellimicrobium mesophilum]
MASPPFVIRITASDGPALRPGTQGFGSVIVPSVPSTTTVFSIARRVAQATSAVIPPGKVSSAKATSSTRVCPSTPEPFTVSGSANGLPDAAPAISRAADTG